MKDPEKTPGHPTEPEIVPQVPDPAIEPPNRPFEIPSEPERAQPEFPSPQPAPEIYPQRSPEIEPFEKPEIRY
jgi:hypothetical protein